MGFREALYFLGRCFLWGFWAVVLYSWVVYHVVYFLERLLHMLRYANLKIMFAYLVYMGLSFSSWGIYPDLGVVFAVSFAPFPSITRPRLGKEIAHEYKFTGPCGGR